MASKQWRNSCCNPFNKVKHSVRDKSQLRTVSKSICEKFPSILPGLASLQKPYQEQIMTLLQLYDWACTSLKAIQFTYCTCAEYSEVKDQLKTWFDNSRTIPGTHQYHSHVPVSSEIVQV